MHVLRFRLAAAVALVGFASASTGTAGASDVTFTRTLGTGSTLEVRAIDGRIDVAAGTTARVVAVVTPRAGEAVDRHAVAEEAGATWIVCAVPLAQTTCSRDADDDVRRTTRIDFRVTLPRGVALRARDVSGDISARGLGSVVDARAVSGNVSITTSEAADAKTVSGNVSVAADRASTIATVSGDIDLELAHLAPSLSIASVSGGVRVAVPHAARASIRARTVSGRVDGSGGIAFAGNDGIVGHDLRATLHGGGSSIEIKTVSGGISVNAV